jgi:hypothetical protein
VDHPAPHPAIQGLFPRLGSFTGGLLDVTGEIALALRRIPSDASAPVSWYVAHIAGCLVGFASRLNVGGLGDALRMLQVHLHAHLPPQDFAARVQAELIRLGIGTAAPPEPPPA